jgi:diaminohydroxyphosphoribosylaminopyrimidine deaminase / 5-amino-6-(5-phosphoribosylamino)uracil reductase
MSAEASLLSPEMIAFMQAALTQALPRLGKTAPNPPVGCVIVRDGHIVGAGATAPGGSPHAEEEALKAAGEQALGAVAFVTLEPCGERSSGAPSCSEKLIEAGVTAVIYACSDPSPMASSRGLERLKQAGVSTLKGPLSKTCEVLIEANRHFYKTGLPMVRVADGPEGFETMFVPLKDYSLEHSLQFMASKGFRRLYVPTESGLIPALEAEGLLTL